MENADKYEEIFKEDYEESKPMARIIIPSTDFPSNVRARVEAMGDPEFQKLKKAWMDETAPELKEQKEQEMWKCMDRLFRQRIADPQIIELKQKPNDLYLIIIGMHAFGAGIYATCMQSSGHLADEFTPDDVEKIFSAFHEDDAYKLGLEELKIPLDSNNKKVLDAVILAGMRAAKASAGSEVFDSKNIHTYMQVLFNAGNTVVMRGK